MKKGLLLSALLSFLIFSFPCFTKAEETVTVQNKVICIIQESTKEGPQLPSDAYMMPDKTIVWKLSEVGWGGHSALIDIFMYMKVKDSRKLVLILKNPGGEVFEGLAIAGLLAEKVKQGYEVEIRVYGLAASAATMVLVAGSPGKRFIESNALVMVHELTSFEFISVKNVTQTEKKAKIMRIIQGKIDNLLCGHTKIDAKILLEMVKEETWLDASDAVKYGFADQVF